MKHLKRPLSLFLCIVLTFSLIPAVAFAAEDEAYSIDNGYIKVSVSKENGGFAVNTVEGDLLKKSDDNKKLLFHDGNYDTSFVSFRVKYNDGTEKDYLFGGKYPGSSVVTVSQEGAGAPINALWSIGDLHFLEVISLENTESPEHGMVSIALACQNDSSSAVSVQARVLYDTCLGDTDSAYYAVSDGTTTYTVATETVLPGANIPQNFYAVDDPSEPGIVAYSVNSSESMPVKAAFGHWNNLASSLFDFVPDANMNFTSAINDYLTADSAYALYFDLGNVAAGNTRSFYTYYGVYSNHDVSGEAAVAINATAPTRLELNEAKTAYIKQADNGLSDFKVAVNFVNYDCDSAIDLNNILLAVTTGTDLRQLGDDGTVITGVDYDTIDPYTISYSKLNIGQSIDKTLNFQARTVTSATYQKIVIGVYDGEVATNKLLGEKTLYVLLPGTDGNIPKVNFASMTPDTIYFEGTRHLYLTVSNDNMLTRRSDWNMVAYRKDGAQTVQIPHENISIRDGVMDVAFTDKALEAQKVKMATGDWYLQLEWTETGAAALEIPDNQKKISGPELAFRVSNDLKFKNDAYGVLAVVKYGKELNSSYKLLSFKGEEDFGQFRSKKGIYASETYTSILLTYRGEFTAKKYGNDDGKEVGIYYQAVSTKTLDEKTREYTVDNPITINGCVDFEGGTMAVYYESYDGSGGLTYDKSAICCEFDGQLYTSDSRTSVWKGKAILTKIEQGKDFALIPYNARGERKGNFTSDTISIIWPNVFGAAQSLLGMAFKMAYGQFGEMKDGDKSLGYVLSFSASLSLSFLKSDPDWDDSNTYFAKMKGLWELWTDDSPSLYQYAYNRGHIEKLMDFKNVEEEDESTKKGVTGSVNVKDILFGCGKGFLGLNFKVAVGIQNYFDGLPVIKGTLEVNTLGLLPTQYSFGVSGSMKMSSFSMEAKLSFKSTDSGIPIPDELYFFVGGFKPGLNVDGCGVIWLTGGGGGIKNLYDTIFLTDAVPPLRLIIAASFSIVQVLDGKAKLEFGLTGFKLEAQNIKIMDEIECIEKILLSLDWYPDLKLQAAISVNLFQGVIEGKGYIVLIGKGYSDWFFEMFIRAALKIPKSVPVVGGMELLGADLGISTEKIWGAVKVIGIGVGIAYYWGEDSVHFGSAGDGASPTYPSLLLESYEEETEGIPVYYDEENDRTLYAFVGTNFTDARKAEVLVEDGLMLMGSSGVWSTSDLTSHKFNLGSYNAKNNSAAVVQVNYAVTDVNGDGKIDEVDALQIAKTFTVKDGSANDFGIDFYNSTEQNENSSNANVSFNDTNNMGCFCFTVTDPADYDMDWYLSTNTSQAELVLYNVEPISEVTDVYIAYTSGMEATNPMTIKLEGNDLYFDNVSFYLTESKDLESNVDPKNDTDGTNKLDGGYPLHFDMYYDYDVSDDGTEATAKAYFDSTVPSGWYYVRCVYSNEDEVNGVIYSDSNYYFENVNEPADLTDADVTVETVGNLKFGVTIENGDLDTNAEAYRITVYDKDDNEVESITVDKDPSGTTYAEIGGSYEFVEYDENENPVSVRTEGLTGGKTYYLGVEACNYITEKIDGIDLDRAVYSGTWFSGDIVLPQCVTPTVTLKYEKDADTAVTLYDISDPKYDHTVIVTNEPVLSAKFSEAVSGTWSLDDQDIWDVDPTYLAKVNPDLTDNGGFISAAGTNIALGGLADGDHVLKISGKAADGDAFAYTYAFTVDTAPPVLMISSPVNGEIGPEDGVLTFTGITEADALITVSEGTKEYCSKKTVEQLGGTIDTDGVFSFTLNMTDWNRTTVHKLEVKAEDAAGNSSVHAIDVTHGGVADIKDLQILVDGSAPAGGDISVDLENPKTVKIDLVGVTSSGTQFVLDGTNVSWQVQAVNGTASVKKGNLTMSAGARGMITGMIEVADGYYRSVSATFGATLGSGFVAFQRALGGSIEGRGGNYDAGDKIMLTANADEGFTFSKWIVTTDGQEKEYTGVQLELVMPQAQLLTVKPVFNIGSAIAFESVSDSSASIVIGSFGSKTGTLYVTQLVGDKPKGFKVFNNLDLSAGQSLTASFDEYEGAVYKCYLVDTGNKPLCNYAINK